VSARSAVTLDSSVWIEILGSGRLVGPCAAALRDAGEVMVPTVVIYEVYRKVLAATGSEDDALSAASLLRQHVVRDLTDEIALEAAELSLAHDLGMADSLVLAHAMRDAAPLVTLDNDLASIDGVRVLRPR
jgi:toxin FitB